MIAAIVLVASLVAFSQSGDKQAADALTKCILSNMNGKSIDAMEAANNLCPTELNAWYDLCKDRLSVCPKEYRYACNDPVLDLKCQTEKREIVDAASRTWEVSHPPPPKPAAPQYVAVTARGVSVVPGAIVCPSHAAVSRMFDLYVSHWEDVTQNAMTNGQSRLIRGQGAPAPDLKSYGCALVPPGTPMTLDTRNVVPVVTAKLPNGTTIKGVTFEAMFIDKQKHQNAGTAFIASLNSPANQQAPKGSAQNPRQVEETKPPAHQPEITQMPKLVPVENSNPPAQPPSVAEIDQQAITLWNQKRYSDAITLFNQACRGGMVDSCYHLGLMYDFGQGVAQDFTRAAAFYTKSCNAGNGGACYHLGMLQYPGQPGGMPCSRAVTLNLSRSCDMGIATSCSEVGLSYIHGCGVAKDTEKGQQLLSKGCSLGDDNACDGIK
jgi:hypothetical protein